MGPLLFRVNQICIAGDGLLEMVQLCKQGVSGKQAIASKYGRDIRCFEAAMGVPKRQVDSMAGSA